MADPNQGPTIPPSPVPAPTSTPVPAATKPAGKSATRKSATKKPTVADEEAVKKAKRLRIIASAIAAVMVILAGFLVWHVLSEVAEVKKSLESQPAPTASALSAQDDKIANLDAKLDEFKKVLAVSKPAQKPAASVGQPTSEDTGAAEQPSKERMSGMPITGTSSVQTSADALAWFEELEKFKDKLSKYLEPSARVVIETKGMPVSIKELNIGEGAVDIQAAETKQEMAEGRARELKAELTSAEAEVKRLEAERIQAEKEKAEMSGKLLYMQDAKNRPWQWREVNPQTVRNFFQKWDTVIAKLDTLDRGIEFAKKMRDDYGAAIKQIEATGEAPDETVRALNRAPARTPSSTRRNPCQ